MRAVNQRSRLVDAVSSGRGRWAWLAAACLLYLILAAQQHASLPAYSNLMLSYVLPLTVVTLVVSFMRRRRVAE